jgi:ABC-type dipeptide/oligopeptide/nickel transport system permease subunit
VSAAAKPAPEAAAKEPAAPEKGVSSWAVAWRQLRKNRVAMFAAASLALLMLTALLSPLLANSKPIICSYKGKLYFPALLDYLDENIPLPFGIAGRLQKAAPSWLSPAYTEARGELGASALPDWKKITREIDRTDKGWYLGALVPYYYKENSSAIKQLPRARVLHLELRDGPAAGEALEVAPSTPWHELLPRMRGRDPELALGAVEVVFQPPTPPEDWKPTRRPLPGSRWIVKRAADAPADVPVTVSPRKGAVVTVAPGGAAPIAKGDVVTIGARTLEVAFPPAHLLGTDDVGRDVLSRVIHGTVIACSVGFVSVGIYVFIGIVVGSLAGYFRGWVDITVSRIIEVVICFPTMFLIICIVALWPASIYNIMIALGLTGWTGVARLVRGEFLKAMSEDYVQAARALGFDHGRIIFRHILPNAIAPVFVSASFGVAGAILVESSLSFLGFGVAPPTASWGEVLQQGRRYIQEDLWHLVWVPGFCIFYTVTMFNLLGEGLRDALDPKLRQ